MTTDAIEKPTLSENLSTAANSSDLTVSPDHRGDADVLIAAGLSLHQVGRYLDQLTSELDACAPPRRLDKDDIERVAFEMPRVPVEKGGKMVMVLDVRGASAKVQKWANDGRRQVLEKLKTLPKLADEDRGVIPWMRTRGIESPKNVLLDVLAWYLDRQCPACHGTKWEVVAGTNRQGAKACRVCRGVGERDLPHGKAGRMVLEHLACAADKARRNTKDALRNMRALKQYVAGRAL